MSLSKPHSAPVIYIIAGEASGDVLGSKLIQALKIKHPDMVIHGIGGPLMEQKGLTSLFPMNDISLMGFAEIVPHIWALLKRINQTVDDIKRINPDCLITIDSPGFNCRIAKKIKDLCPDIKKIHYVAPTVWAYKPARAKKFAALFDHLLVLLPFEPPYFEKEGLETTFIGHPITEPSLPCSDQSTQTFKRHHNISDDATILLAMPGSRKTELQKLLPIYDQTFRILNKKIKHLQIIIPTSDTLKPLVNQLVSSHDYSCLIIGPDDKSIAYAMSHLALVKSGTSTLEIAKAGIPMVVTYKISMLSYFIIKSMIKIHLASLINIIADRMILPEYLQYHCTSKQLSQALLELYENPTIAQQQTNDAQAILRSMESPCGSSPSEHAAHIISNMYLT